MLAESLPVNSYRSQLVRRSTHTLLDQLAPWWKPVYFVDWSLCH